MKKLCLLLTLFLGTLPAASASAAPGLLVGAADDMLKWVPQDAAAAVRALGMRAVRITLRWNPSQTALSATQIAELDNAVAAAGSDIRIVVSIYSTPGDNAPRTSTSRKQYCKFARSVLVRYPSINDVGIWNEPNKSFFWKPQFNPGGTSAAPAAYEKLLARCWDDLHAVRPAVNVIAPGTAPRGNDNPNAVSNISHSPGNFIRKVGEAYRASGRRKPLFDIVAHHAYGEHAAERPWKKHASTTISEGDWDKLMQALGDAFLGTAQPTPGHCAGRCVPIWYLEAGYQTAVDEAKLPLYTGIENEARALPDFAGGEPAFPPPGANTLAPDQWTQIVDGIRLAYCQPYVEAFFNFMLWDEPILQGWQSAPLWADRTPKDSYPAFQQIIGEVNAGSVDCAQLKG